MTLKQVRFLASRLQEHRHVEADQVPIKKRPVVGNGVAGDLVHAGAHGLFSERRRWTTGTREKVRKQTHITSHTQKRIMARGRRDTENQKRVRLQVRSCGKAVPVRLLIVGGTHCKLMLLPLLLLLLLLLLLPRLVISYRRVSSVSSPVLVFACVLALLRRSSSSFFVVLFSRNFLPASTSTLLILLYTLGFLLFFFFFFIYTHTYAS